MPSGEKSKGARPGERRGGRHKGVPNRATIEKAKVAELALAEAKAQGRKLAKDVLEDFMHLFAGMAAHYQPIPEGQAVPPGRAPHEGKFGEYSRLAVDCAHKLAPYQSPTFRAIVIAPPPEDRGEDRKRFTLTIFEGGKARDGELLPPRKAG